MKRNGLRVTLFIGLVCGATLLAATPARAQVVLDQSFTGEHPYWLGAEFYANSNAQTFTAGVSGKLVGVKVDVSLWQDQLPLRVAVRSVFEGLPTDTVLTEITLPLGEPADRMDTFIEFEEPITIVEGTQYALVLNFVDAAVGENTGMWSGGVDHWYGTDYYPGGEWLHSSDGVVFYPYAWADADVHFQTYVDVTPDVRTSIEDFIDDLRELVDDGEIPYRRGRHLIADLELALWFLDFNKGEMLAAIRLELFIKRVEGMLKRDEVDPELGEELLVRARGILDLFKV